MKTRDFIKKAVGVHGEKYDYRKSDYVNSRSKIVIICLCHGEFHQRAKNHLDGQGCP